MNPNPPSVPLWPPGRRKASPTKVLGISDLQLSVSLAQKKPLANKESCWSLGPFQINLLNKKCWREYLVAWWCGDAHVPVQDATPLSLLTAVCSPHAQPLGALKAYISSSWYFQAQRLTHSQWNDWIEPINSKKFGNGRSNFVYIHFTIIESTTFTVTFLHPLKSLQFHLVAAGLSQAWNGWEVDL